MSATIGFYSINIGKNVCPAQHGIIPFKIMQEKYTFTPLNIKVKARVSIPDSLVYYYTKSAMNYKLIKDIIDLAEKFEQEVSSLPDKADIEGFKSWLQSGDTNRSAPPEDLYWEGKENGRSPESAINT